MGQHYGAKIVKDGLYVALDAANRRSYPGTGTTWYDISGNGYDFTLSSASAYVANGGNGAQYMDLETYGCKRLPGGVLTDVPHTPKNTFIILSEVKNNDGDWKTLMRGATADHQVIVSSSNGVSLGMYDNNGSGFINTGYNLSSMPNYNTQFNFMVWKLTETLSPTNYYEFFYNDNLSTPVATLNAAASTYNNGYATVGCYHNASNSPTSFSQEFGKIAVFLHYNRILSASELKQNFNALRGRFNL